MRTRNRRLGPLVQHPPPPLPGRHHTTTSRKSTHNNTKGSGLNKPPQNPGFDTPAKGHCTRYVALHPLRGAAPVTWRCTRYVALHPNRRGAMPTDRVHDPRHKLTCGPARKDVHGPDRLGWARRQRTPDSQPGPAATNPRQPTGPGGNEPPTINRPGSNAPPTTNSARQRTPDSQPGPRAAGPDGPSRRRAERAARGADNERATERAARGAARHQARARRSRAAEPGRGAHIRRARTAGHTYNEAGASRAQQHDRAPAS